MGLPDLTVANFPYLAIVLFILITVLKVVEYSTKRKQKTQRLTPELAHKAVRLNVGALVPFYDLIGVSQYAAPSSMNSGVFYNIVYTIALMGLLFVSELWYGHTGFIILLIIALLANPFIEHLQSYACTDSIRDRLPERPDYCCGGNLMVFLIAMCVNIFFSGTTIGMISATGVHVLVFSAIILLDYLRTKQSKHKLCYAVFGRATMYGIGAITSLLILIYVYAVGINYASAALELSAKLRRR